MLLLISVLSMMLMGTIGLLSIPCFKHHHNALMIKIAGVMIVSTSSLYLLSGNKLLLADWLTRGEQHYQLLVQFQQLGGIDGIIARIEARLKIHPEDAQGWRVLGKMYLMKHDAVNAKKAFEKAEAIPVIEK